MQLLQDIWKSILDITSQFVIPDWGAVIALLPVVMAIVVVAFLILTLVRYRSAGPRRRRPGRVTPPAPTGIHMPGPTYAPFFGAGGTFLLFLGLVFPGPLLALGVLGLVLALLFWGREGLREYDHVAGDHPELPAAVHTGPPPGVHVPGPTFRPILASLGVFLLFLGLVFPGWILAVGVVALIAALLGWLNDARKEYIRTVHADSTGHLENGPDPAWPKLLVSLFAFLIIAAVAINNGWFPPKTAVGGAPGPGASGAPSGSGGPGGSGAPGGGGISIVAKGVAFNEKTLAAPADKAFTVSFDNQDAGTPHDFDVLDSSGAKVFDGKEITGVAQTKYDVPALKAGTYKFECSIHPALMNGQLTVGG
jgi:plastocyanin